MIGGRIMELFYFMEEVYLMGMLNIFDFYDGKIPEDKQNYSYYKSKTFYQNPIINGKLNYFNKTIPKTRNSNISLEGKNIRMENKRKGIQRKLVKKESEKMIQKALKK